MAIQLGSAYGKVSLDVNGLLTGVAKGKLGLQSLVTAGQQVSSGLKNLGNSMTIGLTLPIAALGVASIKMASDMVETKSKVKVVFEEMSDAVMKWSVGSAKSMHLSQQEALEAASTFGMLFRSMKVGIPDAEKMSTTLVQLAGDLGSVNNIDASIVLQKLRSGIVGETEAVRDLGIDLRATRVEAKAMEMGFQKVNGQFEQGALIAARYALIMEDTKLAQGDIALTGGNLAGQLQEMNAQWKDALRMLGENLLPVALQLVTQLNKMLEAFNKMSPAQQQMTLKFAGLLALAGPLLSFLGTLVGIFTNIVFFAAQLSGMGVSFAGIGTVITGTLIPAVGALLTALLPVIAILGGLVLWVGILYLAWKANFLGMRDNMAMFVNVVRNLMHALVSYLHGDVPGALDALQKAFDAFGERVNAVFLKIFGIKDAWGTFLAFVRNTLITVSNYISSAFTRDWSPLGKAIVYGIANGMLLGLPALLQVALNVANAALTQIKKALGISSPSKEFAKLGRYSAQGFQIGLAQAMSPEDIARSISKPVNQMMNSQQQNINLNFASGLTVRDVQGMIAVNNEQLMGALNRAMGMG